ncbi:hypothetical protein EN991_28795, partial [Mesorhizobium sp. M7A.F.Ca.US.005.03.2.1]
MERLIGLTMVTATITLALAAAAAAQAVCGVAATDAGPFTSGGGATATGAGSLACGPRAVAVNGGTSIGEGAGGSSQADNRDNAAIGGVAGIFVD